MEKKTFLLNEGVVCEFEAFVLKGCICTYCLYENGFETILHFTTEHWWVSDIASFSNRKPSRLFIETLEDSEILLIHREDKEVLFFRISAFERLFRMLVQRSLAALQCRYFDSHTKSARKRYLAFQN